MKQENNMSSSSISYDWFSSVNNISTASDVKSLLVVISEIIELSTVTQNDDFITIGCYFYRVSLVIMELESSEILLSLSDCIHIAKDLFSSITTPDSQVKTIMKELESVIKHMGEVLNSIKPSSEEHFHYAVQSLVKDVDSFTFDSFETNVQKEYDLYAINDIESSTDDEPEPEPEPEMTHVIYNIEPLYETFFCPLTNKIMNDPVTIETGVTYERIAITEWFEKFGNPADIICPKTGVKINSTILNRNIALLETIKQWEVRNEQANIKAAKAVLSLASSKPKILEVIHNLQTLCRTKPYNVVEIRSVGVIPLLATILNREDRDLTVGTLELLTQLTQNDDEDEGKKMIATAVDLSLIIQNLASEVEHLKHSALLLLVELSKSSYFCDHIGSVTGGILMLITLKYRQPVDSFASEKVDEILKNLERSPNNIKIMAENGHWQPLLHHFLEGNEEMKMEMGSYLGEIFLGQDDEIKGYVVETVSPVLIQMVFHGNSLARNVAFKALKQISSHPENATILVKSGIASNMFDEMLKRTIYNEPMNSKAEAAAILANILESGSVQLSDLQTDHKMSLNYVVYTMIKRVRNSTSDDVNINFVRILLCLMKFPKTQEIIVSVVKEGDACTNLVELLNNPNEELQVVSIVFSIALSPFFGNILAEKLCKTRGQPQALLKDLPETTAPTEKQAVSVKFLAKLPHENLSLNLALFNAVPLILRKLDQVQRSGTRMSKYGSVYLEGLVGILVRFTSTLYEHQFLVLATTFSFTTVFTELLMNTFSDEIQKLSANGLENLSSKTVTLSKPPPQIKKPKLKKFKKFNRLKEFYLQKCFSFDSRYLEIIPPSLCPVHKGVCSSQETFCLVEAHAVEKLFTCFDHTNIQVVEAALSAICTLLDERVDLDASVSILIQNKAIQHVLNVIKAHKNESLRQKAFWILEKLLKEGDVNSTSEISQDKFLRATLINVLHYGNGDIRLMAEKILRHLS
ncbi:putative U box domain, armadillo repeat-containing domain, armadillo-like helical [Helianthus annuus]|nr:putative U box domain, armadillo repeat-containing domain, armadillo-like helical [Helianthus annuus]